MASPARALPASPPPIQIDLARRARFRARLEDAIAMAIDMLDALDAEDAEREGDDREVYAEDEW